MPSSEPSSPGSVLRASYISPSESKTFVHPLEASFPQFDAPGSEYTKQKTSYLSELKASTKMLQEEMNMFLTQKMEQDKAAAAEDGKAKVDAAKEEKEEQMYGEEDVEEEG